MDVATRPRPSLHVHSIDRFVHIVQTHEHIIGASPLTTNHTTTKLATEGKQAECEWCSPAAIRARGVHTTVASTARVLGRSVHSECLDWGQSSMAPCSARECAKALPRECRSNPFEARARARDISFSRVDRGLGCTGAMGWSAGASSGYSRP